MWPCPNVNAAKSHVSVLIWASACNRGREKERKQAGAFVCVRACVRVWVEMLGIDKPRLIGLSSNDAFCWNCCRKWWSVSLSQVFSVSSARFGRNLPSKCKPLASEISREATKIAIVDCSHCVQKTEIFGIYVPLTLESNPLQIDISISLPPLLLPPVCFFALLWCEKMTFSSIVTTSSTFNHRYCFFVRALLRNFKRGI